MLQYHAGHLQTPHMYCGGSVPNLGQTERRYCIEYTMNEFVSVTYRITPAFKNKTNHA